MLHLPIFKSNCQTTRGFTIVELMTILIIVGILCAIAAPSLMAMQGVAKLNTSIDNVRSALEITQFQALQKKADAKGNTCRIYIPKTAPNNTKIIGNCLISASGSSSGVSDTTTEGATLSTGGSLDGWSTMNLDDGIEVDGDETTLEGDPPKVIYNSKGITQQSGTIVLKTNEGGDKRCLIVNAGAGLLRGGTYKKVGTVGTCEITQ